MEKLPCFLQTKKKSEGFGADRTHEDCVGVYNIQIEEKTQGMNVNKCPGFLPSKEQIPKRVNSFPTPLISS